MQIGEVGSAFEIAIQNKNYGAAECFLRDITLKDAIENGMGGSPYFDIGQPKRRNSY